MENGKPLPAERRTPIMFQGTRTGRQIELEFTETGARRVSEGTFTLEIADDGTLKGSFRSDVADTQGSSLARRLAVSPTKATTTRGSTTPPKGAAKKTASKQTTTRSRPR
jgi:hypothetical protein